MHAKICSPKGRAKATTTPCMTCTKFTTQNNHKPTQIQTHSHTRTTIQQQQPRPKKKSLFISIKIKCFENIFGVRANKKYAVMTESDLVDGVIFVVSCCGFISGRVMCPFNLFLPVYSAASGFPFPSISYRIVCVCA